MDTNNISYYNWICYNKTDRVTSEECLCAININFRNISVQDYAWTSDFTNSTLDSIVTSYSSLDDNF